MRKLVSTSPRLWADKAGRRLDCAGVDAIGAHLNETILKNKANERADKLCP